MAPSRPPQDDPKRSTIGAIYSPAQGQVKNGARNLKRPILASFCRELPLFEEGYPARYRFIAPQTREVPGRMTPKSAVSGFLDRSCLGFGPDVKWRRLSIALVQFVA